MKQFSIHQLLLIHSVKQDKDLSHSLRFLYPYLHDGTEDPPKLS